MLTQTHLFVSFTLRHHFLDLKEVYFFDTKLSLGSTSQPFNLNIYLILIEFSQQPQREDNDFRYSLASHKPNWTFSWLSLNSHTLEKLVHEIS